MEQQSLAGWPIFLTLMGEGSILWNRSGGLNANINFTEVMIMECNLGNIGVGFSAVFEGNKVALYRYCIKVNETSK